MTEAPDKNPQSCNDCEYLMPISDSQFYCWHQRHLLRYSWAILHKVHGVCRTPSTCQKRKEEVA